MEDTQKQNIEQTNQNTDTVVQQTNDKKLYCKFCGNEIIKGNNYCSTCGRSTNDETKKHCPNCGAILENGQKFCINCGRKNQNEIILLNSKKFENKISKVKRGYQVLKNKYKNTSLKKKIKIFIALISLIIICFVFVPNLFVSTDDLLEQGNYKEAYNRASKSEKERVLYENIFAYLSKQYKNALKNPDSFKLLNAWFDKDSDEIVLVISGTNTYGGTVKSYAYYTYSDKKNKYTLFSSVSDLEDEEYSYYDDSDEYLEKIIDNTARECIKRIINDSSYEVESTIISRINNLKRNNMLNDVELIDETNYLKHTNSKSSEDSKDKI